MAIGNFVTYKDPLPLKYFIGKNDNFQPSEQLFLKLLFEIRTLRDLKIYMNSPRQLRYSERRLGKKRLGRESMLCRKQR